MYWTPRRRRRETNADRSEIGSMNFVLLIVLGVAVSYWLMWYSEWFEQFASILALSGGLTWVAVVLKLLTEDQKRNLQSFAQSTLGRASTVGLLSILIVGLVVLASCFCTIRVKLMQDASDRVVLIYSVTVP